MKISYRAAATGAGAYTVLADEATATLGAAISGFLPRFTKNPQVDPLFRATGPFVADRGNGQWTLTFMVARQHASPDAAALFINTEAAIFGAIQNVDLKIEVGSQVNYLVNAALTGFEPDPHSDCSTFIRYGFTAASYTTTAP